MNYLLLTFVSASLFFQTSSSPVNAENIGTSYDGSVTPFEGTIRLVRRPFEEVKSVKTELQVLVQSDSEKVIRVKKVDMGLSAKPFGDGLRLTAKSFGAEITSGGKTSKILMNLQMIAYIAPSGSTRLETLNGTINGQPLPEVGPIFEMMKKIADSNRSFKSNMTYKVGGLLNRLDVETGDLGYSYSARLIVQGITKYKNIPVLVAKGAGIVKGFQFGEFKLDGKISVLNLIHLDNGSLVYQKSTMIMPLEIGGKKSTFKLVEVTAALFPEERLAKVPLNSSRTIKDRLRKLKNLVDEGLLLETEAKEKRLEILDDL